MYNENEPFAIRWLEQLQERNLISEGRIDGRSITELRPEDCGPTSHFFAGIGGWAYALQLAGWDPARPVWTGSCPCQSLSSAGRKRGANDKRHLWPIWYELIKEYRPPTIFGEQVASSLGRQWFAGVRADLEGLGYAVGAADLCAASLGAPHIRSRLYWVAHSNDSGRQPGHGEEGREGREVRLWSSVESGNRSAACRVDDTHRERCDREPVCVQPRQSRQTNLEITRSSENSWSDFDLLACGDGRSRRVESGTFPLAHGIPARVGRLRGYGNAIVPQLAATFIRAFLEAEEEGE